MFCVLPSSGAQGIEEWNSYLMRPQRGAKRKNDCSCVRIRLPEVIPYNKETGLFGPHFI